MFKVGFLLVLRCYIFVYRFSETFLKDVTELCRPGHGGRRSGSGQKRIYSSAVVRNRTWKRGHGRIWSDSIIFSSWVAAKLENAAMDTDSDTWLELRSAVVQHGGREILRSCTRASPSGTNVCWRIIPPGKDVKQVPRHWPRLPLSLRLQRFVWRLCIGPDENSLFGVRLWTLRLSPHSCSRCCCFEEQWSQIQDHQLQVSVWHLQETG